MPRAPLVENSEDLPHSMTLWMRTLSCPLGASGKLQTAPTLPPRTRSRTESHRSLSPSDSFRPVYTAGRLAGRREQQKGETKMENEMTLRRGLRYLRQRAADAPDYLRTPWAVSLSDGTELTLVNAPASDGSLLLGVYRIVRRAASGQRIKDYRVR